MEINALSLFRGLTDEEIRRSLNCSKAKIQKFKRNEYIFRQGDTPDYLYFVLEGNAVLGQINMIGRQNYVEYIKEGQGFGEIDLFLGSREYEYFALARTDIKVLAVSGHFFWGTCETNCAHHSKIIFNMLGIFALEAEKNYQKMCLLTCGTLRQRIASYLMRLSGGKSDVEIPMNREDLAVYLNTTRPSLSRELSRLSDRDVIKITGRCHVRILNFKLLRDEMEKN